MFFLIFTLLWGKSHRNDGLNVAIYHFLKPETNKDDFRLYFELFEKSCRGRHHLEISKTDTKIMISSLWMRPQEPQGCQKKSHYSLNKLMEVWCSNIESKLNKIRKTVRKQAFSTIIYQLWLFFTRFSKFAQFWLNSIARTVLFVKKNLIFLTPLGPLGARPYRFE